MADKRIVKLKIVDGGEENDGEPLYVVALRDYMGKRTTIPIELQQIKDIAEKLGMRSCEHWFAYPDAMDAFTKERIGTPKDDTAYCVKCGKERT